MNIAFYFDHNMPLPLAAALRQRGIDVLTSIEDGTERCSDPAIWARATELSRIAVTRDQDFLAMARAATRSNQFHPGLVFCDIAGVPNRKLTDDLELIALGMELNEFGSKVIWVPM